MTRSTSPLLTDLYELNMVQAYLDRAEDKEAVFEFFVRRLPARRGFLLAAGLDDALDYLDFAKSLGAEYIMFTSFITHIEAEKDKPFFLVEEKEKEDLYRKLKEKARRLGISVRLPSIAPSKGCLCNSLWHGACIFYNGDVCACPFFRTTREFYYHVGRENRVEYAKRECLDTVMGNYRTGVNFLDIWNSEKAVGMRKAVLGGDFGFNPCGTCYYKHDLH